MNNQMPNIVSRRRPINRVILTQPNYSLFGKRSWRMIPYTLGILNACICDRLDTLLYDPNFKEEDETSIRNFFRHHPAAIIGVSSISTEYMEEILSYLKIIREETPDSIIVLGGILPTLQPEKVSDIKEVDYFVMGEGEFRMPTLIEAIEEGASPEDMDGIGWRDGDGNFQYNDNKGFIDNLDEVPIPDYGNLDYLAYANRRIKYNHASTGRHTPYLTTMTSRGCPMQCIFCSSRLISGLKVRMRSPENFFEEVDLYRERYGIKEVLIIDDHFLYDRDPRDKNYGRAQGARVDMEMYQRCHILP